MSINDIKMRIKSKTDSPLFKIILINICVFVVLLGFFKLSYETDDDFAIAAIANGYFGKRISHIVYGNIIYGKVLTYLFTICPTVNWVTVTYCVAIILAYTALGYIIIKNIEGYLGWIFYAVLLCLTIKDVFLIVNFTRVSAFITIAGFVVLFYSLKRLNPHYRLFGMIGGGLCILGSMIRFESFIMAGAFGFGYYLKDYVLKVKDIFKLKKDTKKFFIDSGLLILLFILIISAEVFNRYSYNNTTEWKDYKEFNYVRSQVMDFGFPEYEEFQEQYQDANITSAEYNMINNYSFADLGQFDRKMFEDILSFKTKGNSVSFSTIKQFVKFFMENYLKNFWLISNIILIILYLSISERRSRVLVAWGIFLGAIELFVLFVLNRPLQRVTFIPFLCVLVTILCSFVKKNSPAIKSNLERKKLFYIVVSVVFVMTYYISPLTPIYKNITNQEPDKELRTSIRNLHSTEEFYFLDDTTTVELFNGFTVFEAPEFKLLSNMSLLGGWLTFSPVLQETMNEYEIGSQYNALVNKPNVYLIGKNNINSKLNYIREKYDRTANYALVKEEGDLEIYGFSGNFEDINLRKGEWQLSKAEKDATTGLINMKGSIDNNEEGYLYLEVSNNSENEKYTYRLNRNSKGFSTKISFSNLKEDDDITCRLIISKGEGKERSYYYGAEKVLYW